MWLHFNRSRYDGELINNWCDKWKAGFYPLTSSNELHSICYRYIHVRAGMCIWVFHSRHLFSWYTEILFRMIDGYPIKFACWTYIRLTLNLKAYHSESVRNILLELTSKINIRDITWLGDHLWNAFSNNTAGWYFYLCSVKCLNETLKTNMFSFCQWSGLDTVFQIVATWAGL